MVGVLALGFDLVRLQSAIRNSADATLSAYLNLEEQFGGSADWLKDIQKSVRWIPGHAFQDRHAEDEVSYNARRLADLTKEAADAAGGVGEYTIALANLLSTRAEEDAKLAQTSLVFSAVGLGLIVIGFSLQIYGTALA